MSSLIKFVTLFLVLYALPLAVYGLDMAVDHNYEADAAVLIISAAAVIVLMGQLRFDHMRRREPSIAAPVLEARERWAAGIVRALIMIAGAVIVIAAGRCTLSFWTVVATIVAEMLTVLTTQKIRINRMFNQIINTDCR